MHTRHLAHYAVPYLFCWESAAPLVCSTKRGQSFFLLHCCLIEGTDYFPFLITGKEGGKPWDMATFSLRRQPIMGVNWNSWVEMFAGSAQWGDSLQEAQCPDAFHHLFWLSELEWERALVAYTNSSLSRLFISYGRASMNRCMYSTFYYLVIHDTK